MLVLSLYIERHYVLTKMKTNDQDKSSSQWKTQHKAEMFVQGPQEDSPLFTHGCINQTQNYVKMFAVL